MSGSMEDPPSDDEIFFGKLTLKEFKKHILWNKNSPVLQIQTGHNSKETYNKSFNYQELSTDNHQNDNSINIIESHSEPNLRYDQINNNNLPQNSFREADDSFLQLEGMVNKLCESSTKNESVELNNTLDVIDFILKNGPNKEIEKKNIVESPVKHETETNNDVVGTGNIMLKQDSLDKQSKDSPKKVKLVNNFTPKTKAITGLSKNLLSTPRGNNKTKEVFKTPAPLSQKKPLTPASTQRTPGRSNAFQHVASPVSSYIKNRPQETLLKDVHPKKPLFGCSSIPKLSREVPCKSKVNKENNLPSVAYKSAKATKIINTPNQVKLPQSQWTKKITTSLPRPVVMKHERREVNFSKSLQPEESFAGLPYTQAEVSVCTKKSAYRLDK